MTQKLSRTEAELLLNSVRGIHIYDGSQMRLDVNQLSKKGLVNLDSSERGGDHVFVACNEQGYNYIVKALTS